MSRVPLYLHPSPLDAQAKEFEVRSTEWGNADPPDVLGQLRLSEDGLTCTFVPGVLWMDAGYFPAHDWTADRDLLAEQLLSESAKFSLYSYRLVQAMQRLLLTASASGSGATRSARD